MLVDVPGSTRAGQYVICTAGGQDRTVDDLGVARSFAGLVERKAEQIKAE